MKWLYYLRYFFYIAWNWNFRLAWFTVYHDIKGEKTYGIDTSRLDHLKHVQPRGQNLQYAEIYQGAGYYLLEQTLQYLRMIGAPDGFVDFGAGKGRVMVVAAHYGFTKIRGVEFIKAFCNEAEKNCRRITESFPGTNWRVVHMDASAYPVEKDMHVFFFFNPFKAAVMKQVIDRICQSLRKFPRPVYIIYMNPQLNTMFTDAGFTARAQFKKMQFVEAIIYEKSPQV